MMSIDYEIYKNCYVISKSLKLNEYRRINLYNFDNIKNNINAKMLKTILMMSNIEASISLVNDVIL